MIRARLAFVALLSIIAACNDAAGASAARPGAATPSYKIVFLVRHAEKADVPGNDQPLSDKGNERARALADVLQNSGISSVIVTQWQRTQQTAAPLLARKSIPVGKFQVSAATVPAYADSVVHAVERASGGVLVIGHSNSLPAVIKALGGGSIPPICEDTYSSMFVLFRDEQTHTARVVQMNYGASDPVGSGGCDAMR